MDNEDIVFLLSAAVEKWNMKYESIPDDQNISF